MSPAGAPTAYSSCKRVDRDRLYSEACDIIAYRRLEARRAQPNTPPVINPDRWLEGVSRGIRQDYKSVLAELDMTGFTAERLAARMEHGPQRPPTAPGWKSRTGRCDKCDGNGWVEIDPIDRCVVVVRCDVCS